MTCMHGECDVRSSGRTMTDEDWLEVWARHDQYPA
jgi:hypothetical protein